MTTKPQQESVHAPSPVRPDRSERMGTQSIPRLLAAFSAPAMVGMVVHALYNIVDRIFVGAAVGTDGIAAVTVAFPFMFITLACAMLVGYGGTALISIRLGQQRKADAEHILGNMAVLLVLISILIAVPGLMYLDHILRFFGASDAIMPPARDYLGIILLGVVFQITGFGLNAAIRGEGNPRIAMLSLLISVGINITASPLLMFGFHMGIRGAAWGTIISQAVSLTWVLLYFRSRHSVLKLRLRRLLPSPAICRQIAAIGFPFFLMQLVSSLFQSLLNHQLHTYGGDIAIAVMGIIYTTMMLFAMPIFGLNQGAQPIIGYNFGAGRYDRVRKTLEIAVAAATLIMVAGFAIVMLFPAPLIQLFNRHDAELISLGSRAIRITMLMTPIVGFQIVSASYFQATGKPKTATLLMLSRQVFLLIPAVILLPRYFGLNGIWAAMPTADLIASLLTGTLLFHELRRLKKRPAPNMPTAEP